MELNNLHDANMQILNKEISEHELQDNIVKLAELRGWFVHAVLDTKVPARRQGKMGFPDLVMVRGSRALFVECKSEKGKVSYEQLLWALVIVATGNEYYLWRPSDWEGIEVILGGSV